MRAMAAYKGVIVILEGIYQTGWILRGGGGSNQRRNGLQRAYSDRLEWKERV